MANMHDAQSAAQYLAGQRAQIERVAIDTERPDIIYDSLMPVDYSGDRWGSAVVTIKSGKAYGEAEFINANADDVPMANSGMESDVMPIQQAAIGYWFGLQEINEARQAGVNLQADRAMAARRKAEEFKQKIALEGDSSKNMDGFLNSSQYKTHEADNGGWDEASYEDILADVNAALLNTGNGEAIAADTVLLPANLFAKLAGRTIDNTGGLTFLQYLMNNNLFTQMTGNSLRVRGLQALNEAGTDDSGKMIAYRRQADVLSLKVPGDHQFLPTWQSGPLRFDVPGIMSIAGVQIKRPEQIAGLDGL